MSTFVTSEAIDALMENMDEWDIAEAKAGCKIIHTLGSAYEPPVRYCTTHRCEAEPCYVAENFVD